MTHADTLQQLERFYCAKIPAHWRWDRYRIRQTRREIWIIGKQQTVVLLKQPGVELQRHLVWRQHRKSPLYFLNERSR